MNILIMVGSVYLGSTISYLLEKKKITKDLSCMVANRNKLNTIFNWKTKFSNIEVIIWLR